MKKYSVITGIGTKIYSGNDIEEAIWQRDEFNYEYSGIGACIYQNF